MKAQAGYGEKTLFLLNVKYKTRWLGVFISALATSFLLSTSTALSYELKDDDGRALI